MSQLYLTRLVIETQTPMAINSGMREVGFDSQLARDANGLPYLPGTSIAGVWRQLATQDKNLDEATAKAWFGTTDKRSLLSIGNGALLNSQHQAMTGLVTPTAIDKDPILSKLALSSPHHRDRVAINDRGVAADKAKFDQILLPKGVRFSIDISWQQQEEAQADQWQKLLALWHNRTFALGANTRNGLGQIKVVGMNTEIVALNDLSGEHPATKISQFKQQAAPQTVSEVTHTQTPLCELTLQADSYWRFGSGTEVLSADKTDADIISYSEPSISWGNGIGSWQAAEPVLCGSAIKGILAHRVAFHYNRLTGRFAEDLADASHDEWQARPAALAQLFGRNEERDPDTKAVTVPALAGRLIVEDSAIDYDPSQITVRYHNSIDRFTGGVRRGALYSEELLYQPKLTVRLWLLPGDPIEANLLIALEAALDDIAYGYVPMGAGGGRGTSLMKPEPESYNKENLTNLVKE